MSRPSDIFVAICAACYGSALFAGAACAFTGNPAFGCVGLGLSVYGCSCLYCSLLAREDGL